MDKNNLTYSSVKVGVYKKLHFYRLTPTFSKGEGIVQYYFAFSSHNLQAISKWNQVPFTLNPIALIENIRIYFKRNLINKFSINSITTQNYITVNDGAHDWQLETCYISPAHQTSLLMEAGFHHVKLFGLKNGNELTSETIKQCKGDWIYYLCY